MPITAVPPPDEAAKEAERQALKRDMIQIAAEMNRGLEDELKNFSRSFAEASSKAADLEQQWQRRLTSLLPARRKPVMSVNGKAITFSMATTPKNFPNSRKNITPAASHQTKK